MAPKFVIRGAVLAAAAATALALAPAAAASAAVGGGNVAVSWSIAGAPSAGLADITFPMTVGIGAAHQDGIYYAQQFSFTGAPDVGYIGLQPRPDAAGKQRLHAAFSSFNAGTTTTDGNCSNGADGGAGVSCAVDFDAVYGHTYDMVVQKGAADTWTGTAVDASSGAAVHIGSWSVPGSGNLKPSQVGFVEYYLGVPSCSLEPRADILFGGPTSRTGNLVGVARSGGEYGDCVGRAGYAAADVGNGVHITRGLEPGTTTTSALVGAASGRCLDDPGSNTANGTRVVLWDCNGGANQRWTSTADGALFANGVCLDASGAGTTPGTPVILWQCSGAANQRWSVAADGTVKGVQSGLCLDVVDGATANGSRLQLWTCTGGGNQRWSRG